MWFSRRDRLAIMPLSPLSFLLLRLSSASLSLASGQPVSFSEWLSPLRLRGPVKTERLFPVSSRHRWRTRSPPLYCCAAAGRPRVPRGEIINHSALLCPRPLHPHRSSLSDRCWYGAAMDTQTESGAVFSSIVTQLPLHFHPFLISFLNVTEIHYRVFLHVSLILLNYKLHIRHLKFWDWFLCLKSATGFH